MKKYSPYVLSLALSVTLFVFSASNALAAHTHSSVDRNSLADEVIKTFPIPILFGVELSNIVPDFGDSRGGGTRSHEGQDFHALQGAPIVSPTAAIVLSTGIGDSAGKYVYTANPGGETFRYMHLDYIADIKPGDKLAVGDFIGTVGDTGNAPDGVYHLHFEVRDDKNIATDPYLRLDEEPFSVNDKVKFLTGILRDVKDEDEYAEFLVQSFPADFSTALQKKYKLPSAIKEALADTGANDKIALLDKLDKLIRSIPAIVPANLKEGDSGTAVSLMQTFIIYASEGAARDKLAASGATGYYGSVTSAAILEYQANNKLAETGIFDTKTKAFMGK